MKIRVPKGYREIRLGEKIPKNAVLWKHRNLNYSEFNFMPYFKEINPYAIGERHSRNWKAGVDFKIVVLKKNQTVELHF
jgi:hypothetical protein